MKLAKGNSMRVIALFVVLSTILSLGGFQSTAQSNDGFRVSSQSDQKYSKAVDTLLNVGLSMDTINDIPKEELLKYAETKPVASSHKYYRIMSKKEMVKKIDPITKLEKLEAKRIDGTKKIVELTKDECIAEVEKYNTSEVSDTYKKERKDSNVVELKPTVRYDSGYNIKTDTDGWIKMEIWATYVSGTKYQLSSRWEWLTVPYYRLEDVFGIGYGEGFTWTNDPVYSVYKCDRYLAGYSATTPIEVTTPKQLKKDAGGVGVSYELKKDYYVQYYGTYKFKNHRGYMSYYANVNSTAVRYIGVYGHYAHQETNWSVSPSISYPWGGSLSLSSSSKFDFLSPNPSCSIHVNY